MPQPLRPLLQPRKSPVQARSAASVAAMLEATIQVLLQVGKDRLTTTRVAARAGVSVGTLYQYFPNKRALLQAALKNHLEDVTQAVELVCRQQRGQSLDQMATALLDAFLNAKMKNAKTSVALYAVSSDLDAAKIVQQIGDRSTKAIVEMLSSTTDQLNTDPLLVTYMLQGAMVGVSRKILESASPEKNLESLRPELIFFARSYLNACSTRHASEITRPPKVRRSA